MKLITLLAATAAIAAIAAGAASAQPYGASRDQNGSYNQQNSNPYNTQRDANGYYSQTDQNGYYDRQGAYQRMRGQNGRGNARAYYQQGAYEQNCQSGNQVAGTIFGALAGGLIGSAVSHGNGGAVAGGAVLGGLLGNTVSKDINCGDQPYAFKVYSDGLNGQVGRRYDWSHGQARGDFTPTRAYSRGGLSCRDFTETSYQGGRQLTHSGTACRAQDGNWRFD